jgi:anti-sigma regulatory factor (Ser/Thr protein kinase)
VIRMQDSGPGFDFSKVSSDLKQNEQNFGRGISLLFNLCKTVEYSGNGNRVKAVYEWTA